MGSLFKIGITQILISFAEKVAVKILDKTKLDEKTQRLLSREIASMEKISHPNVIRIFEVFLKTKYCLLDQCLFISSHLML